MQVAGQIFASAWTKLHVDLRILLVSFQTPGKASSTLL